MSVKPLTTSLCQCWNAIVMRWYRLILLVHAPYRPELHYMRGPGPKWHAKHQNYRA